MIIVNKSLDYSSKECYIRLFTGNPIITKEGRVVMGRGAAREVRDIYKDIDKELAKLIKKKPKKSLHFVKTRNGWIGWFKVKNHWSEDADLRLIKKSTKALIKIALKELNSGNTVHLNFPGVGNGKLTLEEVLPTICKLPDNVYVYWEG